MTPSMSRIEQGGSRGFQVKWDGGSKWFADSKHEGKVKAREAANALLTKKRAAHAGRASHAAIQSRGLYSTNTSGVRNATMRLREAGGVATLVCSVRYKTPRDVWCERSRSTARLGLIEAITQALEVHGLKPRELAQAVDLLSAQARRLMHAHNRNKSKRA
jgi:hypothetical protein